MNRVKSIFNRIDGIDIVFLLTLFLNGGFNEFVSCLITVVISCFLVVKIIKKRTFVITVNVASVFIAVFVLGYLFTSFYAIDNGMAFLGFLKFLPVLLFSFLLMQDNESIITTLEKLPYYALLVGIISLIGMVIPFFNKYFVVAERLGGFFQYPNTFAVFLLVCELIIVSKEKYKVTDFITIATLLVIVLLTGSRTVFILLVISNAVMLFLKKGVKIKIIVISVFVALTLSALMLYPVLKDHEFFGRFYALSFSESTFVGRLLYYVDALPLIIKNPFGYGYMGYYNLQQSVQTGLYSIKFIHNDLLQILLDIGWIPAVLFVVAVVKSICSKTINVSYKIILITLFVHCLFDFNLQFLSMFFVLLLFLGINKGKRIEITKSKNVIVTLISLLSCVSVYFGVSLIFAYVGFYEIADTMYPYNTENKIQLLIKEKDLEKQNEIANEIIEQNQYVSIAYSAKAHYAFSQGDFEKVMEYKNYIFQIAPFAYEEYEEYAYMLVQGIYLYNQVVDTQSADVCCNELINTKEKLQSLDYRISDFGRMINDQVKTTLPDDIENLINSMEVTK